MNASQIASLRERGVVEFGGGDGPSWSLTAVGDTSPWQDQADRLLAGEDLFGDVPELLAADVRYVNWEGAVGDPPSGAQFAIHQPPEAAERALSALGFDLFCVANNHTTDLGPDGLATTLATLARYGDVHGAGADLARARQPVVREVRGVRVGFLAYAQPEANGAGTTTAGVAPLRREYLLPDLAELRGRVDTLVVSLHEGYEFTDLPRPQFKRLCHDCVAAGADLVLGHHPHVPQGVEAVGQALVCYSLGNFFFDIEYHRTNEWTRIGPIWRFEFTGPRLARLAVTPVKLNFENRLVRLGAAECAKVRAHLAGLSARVADDAAIGAYYHDFIPRIARAVLGGIYQAGVRQDIDSYERFLARQIYCDPYRKVLCDLVRWSVGGELNLEEL